MKYSEALKKAKTISKLVRINGKKVKTIIAGSIRRKKQVIRDIDILAITNVDVQTIELGEIKFKNKKKAQFIFDGVIVDIFVVRPSELPFALLQYTGPANYNIRIRNLAKGKGYKLNQYYLEDIKNQKKLKFKTEADVQRFLGVRQRKPEER